MLGPTYPLIRRGPRNNVYYSGHEDDEDEEEEDDDDDGCLGVGNSTILNKLSAKHRSVVLKRIATDLPVKVTAQLVDDDDYWRRCGQTRWPVCDVSCHGGRWKRMFFERNLQVSFSSLF